MKKFSDGFWVLVGIATLGVMWEEWNYWHRRRTFMELERAYQIHKRNLRNYEGMRG